MSKMIKVTETQLTVAFTEWDRRFRENPEAFMNEAMRLLKTTSESYGERCASYFMKLLEEMAGFRVELPPIPVFKEDKS